MARQTALMEDVRIEELDEIAESIGDIREQRNTLNQAEKEHRTTALQLLRKHGKTVWTHAGVELVRVPGDEKVRVRLTKGKGSADEQEDGE